MKIQTVTLYIHDCQNTYTDSYNCLPIFPRIHDYNGFSLDNIDAHHSSYYLYHSSCYTDNLPDDCYFCHLCEDRLPKFTESYFQVSCIFKSHDLFNLKVNCINAMIQEHYHNVENVHIANSNNHTVELSGSTWWAFCNMYRGILWVLGYSGHPRSVKYIKWNNSSYCSCSSFELISQTHQKAIKL
jgi:hypothetical protein